MHLVVDPGDRRPGRGQAVVDVFLVGRLLFANNQVGSNQLLGRPGNPPAGDLQLAGQLNPGLRFIGGQGRQQKVAL